MNLLFDPQWTDDRKRAAVYAGDVVVTSPLPAALGLVTRARELLEEAFAPHHPVQAQYHFGNAVPLTDLGLVIARHPWLCHALAAAAIACEVCYPLALVSRWARVVAVPGTLAMQIGIRVLLGPTFLHMMACNVFWVPWERLLRAAQRRAAARTAS